MTFQEKFNLVPPCLRDADGGSTRLLNDCLLGSISYYIELLLILVAITAFFYIVYSGIQMATAFGNEGKYTAAKSTLLHAVIGIIIATLAYTIVSFVTSFFGVANPGNFDSDTGQEIVNDPEVITALVALRTQAQPPTGSTLSEAEYTYIASNGSAATVFTAPGPNAVLYIINQASFSAQFIRADNFLKPVTVTPGDDGQFWARLYGPTTDFRGGKLIIYQTDPETGRQNSKEVAIK